MANTTLTCSGTPSTNNPAGIPLIPGLPPDPYFSNPNINQYRCLVDPTHWGCPSVDTDDGTWSTSGGPFISIPNCYGESVADCESAINGALASAGSGVTAGVTVSKSPTYDPNIALGVVEATSPGAGTQADASTVAVEVNSDDSSGACDSETHNFHWSKAGQTMVAKAWITCGFTSPSVSVTGVAWACTQEPLPIQTALDSGSWGCSRVATVTQAFAVETGVRAGPLLIGSSVAYQANQWYCATAYGSQVLQSWAQCWLPPAPAGA